jgi:NADH dehydrogenase (ubiquinone) 1 alpha subcomplex subunit 5
MRHKGKLKYSTGQFALDVEPFPRLKIMMLCDIINGLNKQIPDRLNIKHYIHEYVKFIMRVVDENESIFDIESKFPQYESAEKLIMALHDQVTFSRMMVEARPWEEIERQLKDFDYKGFFYVTIYINISKALPLWIR